MQMKQIQIGYLCLIVILITACGTSETDLTVVAQHSTALANISGTRLTVTVNVARMQTTQEYIGTRVAFLEQRGQFLQATLVSRGTDQAFIERNLPDSGNLSIPTFMPPPTSPVVGVITPPAVPNATEEAPNDSSNLIPELSSGTLINPVMSSGVDDNDCPINRNPPFTPQSTDIYVVAIAQNVTAGTNISSVWQRNGIEVAQFSFTPESNIESGCIWFFIDQTDVEFTVASWSVTLRLDGVEMTTVPFSIVEG